MPSLHQDRHPTTPLQPGPSAATRASGLLPFRPYRPQGRPAPWAAAEARVLAERYGTYAAGPGPDGDPLAPQEPAGDGVLPDEAAETPPPAGRCDACGYFTTAPGHLIACGS